MRWLRQGANSFFFINLIASSSHSFHWWSSITIVSTNGGLPSPIVPNDGESSTHAVARVGTILKMAGGL
ncbi:hypothetical protein R1flu_002357 [Riccia fluitans]|uniref:Secreted protein n=1 Tax=Riccia fluitans TaxID=41844 RepID=A0ABD1Y5W4_9MARC